MSGNNLVCAAVLVQGANVDPLLRNTNGYDFGNGVEGDTYVWLLGNNLADWHASRREFIELAGPTPLLPDYAYLLRRILVYKPKDLNRDWSPRFSTLRDKKRLDLSQNGRKFEPRRALKSFSRFSS